jgi:fatty-acyl-CoA synthase
VVIDDETGQSVPNDGETIGEIRIKSNTIMKGYLKNPEATREAFVDGYFRTGDLAVMHPNDYVEIKDRLKDIIISGGENISSVEIEGVLHRHPDVAIAAVVAKPDDKWGEVPCAFVELKPEKTLTEEELIEFTRQHLAGFKRPKQIVFMTIPKTATGKLQKFELRKMVKEGQV